jgi:DNA-binding YbaB/EbfC family protein
MDMRGAGNMQGMMKQMQKMQKKMAEAQEELGEKRLEGAAGGGMVKVIVSGDKQVVDVIIDPSVVDPEDVEMLQDLVVIATNEAMAKAEELTNSTMGQFTKGLNLPGMF